MQWLGLSTKSRNLHTLHVHYLSLRSTKVDVSGFKDPPEAGGLLKSDTHPYLAVGVRRGLVVLGLGVRDGVPGYAECQSGDWRARACYWRQHRREVDYGRATGLAAWRLGIAARVGFAFGLGAVNMRRLTGVLCKLPSG